VVPGAYNQGMYFGTLPAWLTPTVAALGPTVRAAWAAAAAAGERDTNVPTHAPGPNSAGTATADPPGAPEGAVPWERMPLFDQATVNVYGPRDAITAHVDLHRFEDGIAVVSLGSTTTMTFAPVPVTVPASVPVPAAAAAADAGAGMDVGVAAMDASLPASEVAVLLAAGDLLLLTGAARYAWTHRIDAAPADRLGDGQWQPRGSRVSLTFRRLTATATVLTHPSPR
jgi:hypothetical protein